MPMNDRDARLLPRLLDVLNTADNEQELGMAVLQVRRILATDGKRITDLMKPAPAAGDMIDLEDERQEIAVRLRDLGLMLRFAAHAEPEMAALLQQMAMALAAGKKVTHANVRVLLACLRDLIKGRLDEQRPRQPAYRPPGFYPRTPGPYVDDPVSYTSSPGGSMTRAALEAMMEEMKYGLRDRYGYPPKKG